jgi:hypothetical protein
MIVISPRAFGVTLTNFLNLKRSRGQPVEWVALEDVLQKSSGADDPERIKRYLYKEWRERKAGYALLVGDVDTFPVRYMVLDRKTPAAFDYAFYPSDLYYADLAKPDGSFEDWNSRKDSFHAGYYGEVRGETNKSDPINFDDVDYLPEIAVGRWPASKADEVQAIAWKSLGYEDAITTTSVNIRRAAFFSVGGWVDSRGLLGALSKKLEETGTWKVERRFYSTETPAPDHEQMRNILAGGTGLLVHAGHGQPNEWEQCFSMADLPQGYSVAPVPVILSAGCSTAHFAPLPPYEPYIDLKGISHRGTDKGEKFTEPPVPPAPLQMGKINPTCLGEQLLKKPWGGAAAYIGCNTGSQPYGLTLVDGFISEVARAKQPVLGDCWNAAIRYYVTQERLRELKPTDSWTPPSVFFQAMKFMVFGDPSMKLPAKSNDPATPKPVKEEEKPAPPPSIDLRPALEKCAGPTRGQGARGTCSVFTMTGALEFALGHKGRDPQKLSVEFLNWASNQCVRQNADGGFFHDLLRGYSTYGICEEEKMPYARKFDPALTPDPAVIETAKKQAEQGLSPHWIKKWNVRTGLEPAQFTAIKETLAAGWPVCGGFRWPKQERWENDILQMCPPEAVFDGHSILLAGYKDDPSLPGGGIFYFRNTNRPRMACAMSYEYARAYMNDAVWIEGPSGAAPAETAKPQP